MKATFLTALAAAALFAFAPPAAAEVAGETPAPQNAGGTPALQEKTPEQLIDQLRSDDFDQRRDAAARLEKLGDAARAPLERAAKDEDPDVRASAVKILARLLKATLQIHLVDYEGKPAADTAGEITFGAAGAPGIAQVPGNPAVENEIKPIPFKTNTAGIASIKLDSTGQLQFRVKVPGWVDDESENTVDARAGVNVVLVSIKRGASAQGVVLGADGKPFKDAQVALFSPGSVKPELLEMQLLNAERAPVEGKEATTDQNGKWHFENISDGVYVVCVKKADGHFPALGTLFRVHEGESKDAGQIALKARNPGKLKAALLSKKGKPLAKFPVWLSLMPAAAENTPALRLSPEIVAYRQEQKETDENGVVELEDLSPGKYQLQVIGQTEGPDVAAALVDTVVEIKPGETTQVDPKARAKDGSIKGRILSEDGNGVKDLQVQLVTEREVLLYMNNGNLNNSPIAFRAGIADSVIPRQPSVTDNKGVYRFENIQPGKYALIFNTGNGDDAAQAGYVFGVEVKSEARTEAPDAVFKGNVQINAQTAISGRVLVSGGGPLAGAEIHFLSAGGEITSASDEEGNFVVNQASVRPRDHAPKEFLVVRHAGYKPLGVQAPFQPRQEFRLEKQDYGALRITITDDAGKPIPGAAITPLASTVSNDLELQAALPLKGVTNSKGFVRMTGLAAGKRELSVQALGYFLPAKTAEAEVVPNDERELTLALHTGYRVTGRVQLPPAAGKLDVIVSIDDSRSAAAGADGSFAFDAVLPGEHFFTASAAGMGMNHAALLKLPRDPRQYKAESVVIEMQPNGGLAVDCGKELAGHHASLMPVESLNELDERTATNFSTSDVDAEGRAEFLDIGPGQYLLSISDRDPDVPASFGGASQNRSAEPLAGPFEVKPIGTRAAIATLPAVKVAFTSGSGKVTGRVALAGQHIVATEQSNVTISLKIQSRSAIAKIDFSDSIGTLAQTPAAPLIVGTPPEGFKPRVPGAFEVDSLPAGSYTIFASFSYYNFNEDDADNQSQTQQSGKFKQIGTFTIKDGQKLDLGALNFEPDEVPDLAKPAEILKNMLRPIDRAQDFEP